MIRFALARLLFLVPAFLGIVVLTFALLHLIPGDPVQMMLGERVLDPARHAEIMRGLGLDRPLPVQLLDYLGRIVRGDFGLSIATKQPVLTEFLTLLPATVELSAAAMVFAVGIGMPLGITAARRRGTTLDHAIMTVSLTGYSMPIFWWGLLLVLAFSVGLQWTPVSGRIGVEYYFEGGTGLMLVDSLLSDQDGAFRSAVAHLVLPAFALGTVPMAVIARMTRSSMLETLGEDYIRTARAKGLREARVVGVHGLRNALIPVVTVVGLQIGTLLGGAILTETIFSWPGIGRWLVDSIFKRDYPAVQGGVLLIATMVILVNLTVDLLYGVLNPRVRHAAR
ncbi:ABC transporter permease [Inquilinus limosus]|uniref:ABC transporter permease n=1 Tax=Inquilinus limosus TaxID=171674 RepID=UPI000407098B|nr:ABC transporter permease subunit [Inquilinus limosus]